MIGDKIKELRLRNGLTQKLLGEKCGIAEPTIRKYELGKLNPKVETVKKIADALNVPVSEIMDWSRFDERYPNLANEVKLIESVENEYGEGSGELLDLFSKLNSKGKEKAIDSLSDLTMIDIYKKEK